MRTNILTAMALIGLTGCFGIQEDESSDLNFEATEDTGNFYTGPDEDSEGEDTDTDPVDTDLDTDEDTDTDPVDDTEDEDQDPIWYQDADGDGFGNPDVTYQSETAPAGYVDRAGDCNDQDPTVNVDCTVTESDETEEVTEDPTEETEEPVDTDPVDDIEESDDSEEDPVEECDDEFSDALCPDPEEPEETMEERCEFSDAAIVNWFPDDDGDGFGDDVSPTQDCEMPWLNYVTNGDDCDDLIAATHPGAEEVCDLIDNNCDGEVNEGLEVHTWYPDDDADGFGDDVSPTFGCEQPALNYVTNADDCDDLIAATNPDAIEVCDDDTDNNCDDLIDEEDVDVCPVELECPDLTEVCTDTCAGEPEPDYPDGCPVAMCACDELELCATGFDEFLTYIEVYAWSQGTSPWDYSHWYVPGMEIISINVEDIDTVCKPLSLEWEITDVIEVGGYAWFGPSGADKAELVYGPTAGQENATFYLRQGDVRVDCPTGSNDAGGGEGHCN